MNDTEESIGGEDMPESRFPFIELLQQAGFDVTNEPLSPVLLRELRRFERLVGDDPAEAIVRHFRAWKQIEASKRSCAQAAEAAENLEKLLKGLLRAAPVLCRLEGIERDADPTPRVLCRIGGQLRAASLHPDIPLEEIEHLEPWEYVCVATTGENELVAVGTYRDPSLREAALGEVVDFRGYQDRTHGLARVARHGDDEEVVRLSSALRADELAPPQKLVLLRDERSWAIDTISTERPESRFEVPIEQIHQRLEDLAGIDDLIEPLIEDVVLRAVRTDVSNEFDLRPIEGLIIHSFRAGSGKTSLVRGLARWLSDLGAASGFDVVLYVVPPNALKNMYHGEDARLVREELCGSIRARRSVPREQPLFQLIVFDEIDSLGRRVGGDDPAGLHSPAQNDAVQALLAEMDGMIQERQSDDGPPTHVLWIGLTNRLDMVDPALKRGSRFADRIFEMPRVTQEAAESIMAVYARSPQLRWEVDDEVRSGLSEEEVRLHFLAPALALVFDTVILRYDTDGQRDIEVRAGEVMVGVHYRDALNAAKTSAARRRLYRRGVPALTLDDVVGGLLREASTLARTLAGDRQMLTRQLDLKVPVLRVSPVDAEELTAYRFLRPNPA